MQALGREACRPSLYAVCQQPWRPLVARTLCASTPKGEEQSPQLPQLTPPPFFADEAYSAIKVDSDNKTVSTAVGELPISPLMDPAFHEARQKFTKPKPTRSGFKPTKFQRHLARNPYARALATPIRKCPISGACLPNFFLQRFNLVAHPETGEPWFMPRGLEKKGSDAAITVRSTPSERSPAEPEPPEPEPEAKPAEAVQSASDGATPEQQPSDSLQKTAEPPRRPNQTGPSAYVLSRQRLFQELQQPNSLYFNDQRKLLRMSIRGQSRLSDLLRRANWRSDMDAVVLELTRRRIADALCHFAKLVEEEGRGYIVKCERWQDVKALKHRGCLLYLGLPEGTPQQSEPEYVPPRLSTMDMGPVKFGWKLAVHNLRELLGENHIRRLRQESALLRDGSLYLLGRQATVNLQMLLWKLQGYMAWEGPQEAQPGDQAPKSPKPASKPV